MLKPQKKRAHASRNGNAAIRGSIQSFDKEGLYASSVRGTRISCKSKIPVDMRRKRLWPGHRHSAAESATRVFPRICHVLCDSDKAQFSLVLKNDHILPVASKTRTYRPSLAGARRVGCLGKRRRAWIVAAAGGVHYSRCQRSRSGEAGCC
jgi:hypothetical protein